MDLIVSNITTLNGADRESNSATRDPVASRNPSAESLQRATGADG